MNCSELRKLLVDCIYEGSFQAAPGFGGGERLGNTQATGHNYLGYLTSSSG